MKLRKRKFSEQVSGIAASYWSVAKALEQFHTELGDKPGSGANAQLRYNLHVEEHVELEKELLKCIPGGALDPPNMEHVARELADVVYVCYGTAFVCGIDLDAAIREVHRAGMEKLEPFCEVCEGSGTNPTLDFERVCERCNGTGKDKPIVREDGKVLKPEGFTPPDMSSVVNRAI